MISNQCRAALRLKQRTKMLRNAHFKIDKIIQDCIKDGGVLKFDPLLSAMNSKIQALINSAYQSQVKLKHPAPLDKQPGL